MNALMKTARQNGGFHWEERANYLNMSYPATTVVFPHGNVASSEVKRKRIRRGWDVAIQITLRP